MQWRTERTIQYKQGECFRFSAETTLRPWEMILIASLRGEVEIWLKRETRHLAWVFAFRKSNTLFLGCSLQLKQSNKPMLVALNYFIVLFSCRKKSGVDLYNHTTGIAITTLVFRNASLECSHMQVVQIERCFSNHKNVWKRKKH